MADEMVFQNRFDFWGILDRRKWIVFLGLLAGIGLGVLYYYQTPILYKSTAKIRIAPRNPINIQLHRFGQPGGILPNAEDILPLRHDKIIDEKITVEKCLDGEKQDGALYKLPSFEGQDKDAIVELVKKNLTVVPDKEDPFNYEMEYISTNMNDAPTILNHLVRTYQQELDQTYTNKTSESVSHLKQIAIETAKNLDDITRRMEELNRQDTVPRVNALGTDVYSMTIENMYKNLALMRSTLSELTVERDHALEALEMGVDATEAQVQVLEQRNKIRIEKSTNDAEFRASETSLRMIMEIQVELESERTQLGSGHPRIRSLESRLELTKKMIEDQRYAAEQLSGLITRDPALILQYYVQGLDQQIENYGDLLQKDMVEYQNAMRGAQTVQHIRQQRTDLEEQRLAIVRRSEEVNAKITEISPTGVIGNDFQSKGVDFRELRSANKAEVVWPILPVVLALGGVIGSLLGFGLGCLVDLADKTFHNPDEVIRHLGLPLIGHIPVIAQGKRYQLDGSPIDTVVCVHHRPRCQSSESFRAVRTALFFNTQERQSFVIQVTSPTPGDGKSTIAANVAVSIAQSGKRVLLVDGDMRRPRLAQMFNIESKEGFSTVLSGESVWKDVVFECEEIEGLSILPCGVKPSNPAELSTSPQVKQLIEQMRNEYDFVVIDTPPLLAVTDPCPIAARVDGVILSMRIKKNVRISAERAVDILANLGANVVGVVVNGVGAQSGYGSQYTYGAYRAGYSYNGYGSGYGYGYGYGHYYDDAKKSETGRPTAQTRRIETVPVAPRSRPDDNDDDLDLELDP